MYYIVFGIFYSILNSNVYGQQWTSCDVNCGFGTRACEFGKRVHPIFCGGLNETECFSSSCWHLPIVSAVANFDGDVTGKIRFSQYEVGISGSPINSANISINLNGNTLSNGGGWHVHKFPPSLDIAGTGVDTQCSPLETGGHFYPTLPNKDIDQYEEGDLSGKFGELSQLSRIRLTLSNVSGSDINEVALIKVETIFANMDEIDRVQARITLPDRNGPKRFEDLDEINSAGWYEIPLGGKNQPPIDIKVRSLLGRREQTIRIDDLSPDFIEKEHIIYSANGLNSNSYNIDNFIKRDKPSYLKLTGKDSILGRSIVFHRKNDGSRWLCATIVPDGDYVEAIATFTGPVQGRIVFRQQLADDPYQYQTSMYVRVNYSNHGPTEGHKWHVHVNPVGSDGNASTARCGSTGGHWDPSGVKGPCVDQNVPSNCEVGDLSGKHGFMSLPTQIVLQDMHLPLYGADSILGRSITIHAADGGSTRLACATITDVMGRTVKRRSVTYDATGDVVGDITFQQTLTGPYTKYPNKNTFSGSGSIDVGNVMLLSLDDCKESCNADSSCDCITHDETSQSCWKRRQCVPNDFANGDNRFDVYMKNTAATNPVIVTANLRYTSPNMASTFGHKWHVHIGAVGMSGIDDHTSKTELTTRCKSTGGHYDPTDKLSLADYSNNCGMESTAQIECEVGDLYNKHGPISIPTKRTWKDYSLSLVGRDSIVGRSVVIHATTGQRLACSSVGDVVVTSASFSGDLAGVISFSQDRSDATAPAIVFIKLSNGTNGSVPSGDYEWYLARGNQATCENNIFPNGSLDGCGPNSQELCGPNDMMGKHGSLNLPIDGLWLVDLNVDVSALNNTFFLFKKPNGENMNCVTLKTIEIEKIKESKDDDDDDTPDNEEENEEINDRSGGGGDNPVDGAAIAYAVCLTIVLLAIIFLFVQNKHWLSPIKPLSKEDGSRLAFVGALFILVICFSFLLDEIAGSIFLALIILFTVFITIRYCSARKSKENAMYASTAHMRGVNSASSTGLTSPTSTSASPHLPSSSTDMMTEDQENQSKVERGSDGLWRVTQQQEK